MDETEVVCLTPYLIYIRLKLKLLLWYLDLLTRIAGVISGAPGRNVNSTARVSRVNYSFITKTISFPINKAIIRSP